MSETTRAAWLFIKYATLFLVVYIAWVVLIATPAPARWKAQYAQQPQAVQDWFKGAQLTAAAHARLGFWGCCDGADVVEAKFAVSKLNGADQWFYQRPGGAWQLVPPDIIHWGEHAPSGRATMFVLPYDLESGKAGDPVCFYPPESGN